MSSSRLAKRPKKRRQKAPDESAPWAGFRGGGDAVVAVCASRPWRRQPGQFLGRDAPASVSLEHRADRHRRNYDGCGVLSCFTNCTMRFPKAFEAATLSMAVKIRA
jgi:hypothetical protein